LAPRRHPGRLEGARGSVGEADESPGLVVDLDRPTLAVGRLTLDDLGRAVGRNRFDLADDEPGERDDVAAEIGNRPSATARIQPPGPRRCRIGHVVLGVNPAKVPDFTDFATRDELAGKPGERILEVIEADEGGYTRRFGCRGEAKGSRGIGGQRLFAVDRLLRRNRGHGHRLV
jgi:hypothetical protein